MEYKNAAAISPPRTGEITQEAAIFAIVAQETILKPAAAIPAPITPPTIECVVETGAFIIVAKFNHKAAAKSAAIIAQMKGSGFPPKAEMSMMPFLIVLTTSPPAINAPAASKIAAITIATVIVIAFDPTAGPTLFATSFAPMFIAIYAPMSAATAKNILFEIPPLLRKVKVKTPIIKNKAKPNRVKSVPLSLSASFSSFDIVPISMNHLIKINRVIILGG